MTMTESDIWLHEQLEALTKPSFIKKLSPQLSENSASWLIERLKELCSKYSGNDLDAIFNMFEEYWVEYTEIIADDEIQRRSSPPQSSIQLPNWLDPNCDPDSELYFGEEVVLEDKESLKKSYSDEFDELYPSSLERLQILFDETDWGWRYTSQFGDKAEVEPYEVAIVIAVEMLGFYLQLLIHKNERDYTGHLAFDINEVHQAHHLAQQLKYSHELNSTTRQLQSEIPKKELSKRAALGGKAKASKRAGLKEHLFNLFETNRHSFQSLRQAAHELNAEAENYCEKHKITPLAPTNSERTIYDWLRKHEKQNKNDAY